MLSTLLGISDVMIPSYNTHFKYFYEASKDPPVEATDRKECGCYRTLEVHDSERSFVMDSETVTSYYLCPEHMKEHLARVVKQQDEGSKGIAKVNAFPTLADFNASASSEAQKWTDLVEDTV